MKASISWSITPCFIEQPTLANTQSGQSLNNRKSILLFDSFEGGRLNTIMTRSQKRSDLASNASLDQAEYSDRHVVVHFSTGQCIEFLLVDQQFTTCLQGVLS